MFGKCLAILSVVLVGCLAASGSAFAAQFKAEAAPVEYVGDTIAGAPLVFSTSAGTGTCTTTRFGGTNNGASATADMPVTFGAGTCTNFGEAGKSIVTNECSFKFAIGKLISEGTLEVVCPEKLAIEIRKTECTVSIGSQKPLGNIAFKNFGVKPNRGFEPVFEIKGGLAYTVKGPKCGTAEGAYANGGITGTGEIFGLVPATKAAQSVWVE